MKPPQPWPIGPRLAFRPIEQNDAKGPYAIWINNPAVKRFLAARYDYLSRTDIEAYIEANNSDPVTMFLAVCLRENGQHIGNIKLQNVNQVHATASVSIVIGETALWGSGIGTEAIAVTCMYAFDTLGLHRLDAGCFAENLPSVRIFEKCGFKREGLSREVWLTNDIRHDTVRMGLLHHDEQLWRQYLRPCDERLSV